MTSPFLLRLFTCVVLALASQHAAAKSCAKGEAPTPANVIKAYAPGGAVPAGKVACRLNGPSIVVPAISHEAAGDDPPCGNDVVVHSSALGPYKELLQQAGNAGLASDNPWGVAAGAVIIVVVKIDPQVAHNATANCGIASITLPKRKVPFHHYVTMRYDSHMNDVFWIDQNDFDRAGAGEPFQKASWLKSAKGKSGVIYGALYKNWATESGNYRHVMLVVDVFE